MITSNPIKLYRNTFSPVVRDVYADLEKAYGRTRACRDGSSAAQNPDCDGFMVPVTPIKIAQDLNAWLVTGATKGLVGLSTANMKHVAAEIQKVKAVRPPSNSYFGNVYMDPNQAWVYWDVMHGAAKDISNYIEGTTPFQAVMSEVKADLEAFAQKVGGIIPSFSISPWMLWGGIGLFALYLIKK